jgi:NAD(P)-dependent dehydrogenase (short-subunit alcohol dehydrogenase family)
MLCTYRIYQYLETNDLIWAIPPLLFFPLARDETQGVEACAKLKGNGVVNVESHQLDITSQESIEQLKNHVKDKFGGLDVLINNAGILIPVRYEDHISILSEFAL